MQITYKKLINYDDYPKIKNLVDKGLITERFHNKFPNLAIYNYTKKCQYEMAWNCLTLQCRGLILDHDKKEIVARPFPKFFNLEEIKEFAPEEYPKEQPSQIFEKYDGSLGIMYVLPNGDIRIATRGSFHSDQSDWANMHLTPRLDIKINDQMLSNYADTEYTHLFEIIYYKNKIVCKYDFNGLVYLGSIKNKDGKFEMFNFQNRDGDPFIFKCCVLPTYIDTSKHRDNKEGFVLKFNDLFVKVKHNEYVRLHRILTGLTPKKVLEILRDGIDDKEITEGLDEEHLNWYDETKSTILKIRNTINAECVGCANRILTALETGELKTRKDAALYMKVQFKKELIGIIFTLIDKKEDQANRLIWKMTEENLKKQINMNETIVCNE